MKKLILIGGSLATGKSTYANILKDKYNLLVINKDNLKEILGDNIYVETREENKKLSVISFEIMKYLVLKNMDVLVLESNFKDYELRELETICNETDIKVLSIIFDGNSNILHKRFLERLNMNRHYVHKSQDFSNINDFINTLDELRNAKYFGNIIKVNCDDFSYQENCELFNKIEEFLQNNK